MDTKNVSKDFFNRDNLRKLADKPNTEVYEYVHDTPATVVPAKVVEAFIAQTRAEVAKYCASAAAATAAAATAANRTPTRVQCRLEILRAHPEYHDTYAKTHPRIFDMCCDPKTSDVDFRRLLFLVFMRERQEAGLISDELASFSINNFLLEEFKMPAVAPDARTLPASIGGIPILRHA